MKVLLISPNRERVPDPVFPLGLSYIATALKREGHEVSALDLCFENDITGAIRDSIVQFDPELVGLSIRNIDDVTYPKCTSYIDLYKEVVSAIRDNTEAPLVLGGAGLTIMPEAFMEELGADFGVAGEGEETLCHLIASISDGKESHGTIIRSDRTKTSWSDIVPDRSLFDTARYYEHGGMLSFQTKRGCPFQCIYCSYPLIEGKTPRVRNPHDVVNELEMIISSTGVRYYFIVDSIFNYPPGYAEDICDAIIERGIDIRWTCYGNPAYVSERLAEKMRRAGCTSIEFGADSMLDETLGILKKGFTFKHVQKASKVCRDADIRYCHFIFIGAPGDTPDRVKENLERLESLGADISVIMAGLRIYPDTKLASLAAEEFGIDKQLYSIDPVYYISPDVIQEIDGIVSYIQDNHPKWVLPGFEINFNERMMSLLRRAGIKGSLWEEFIKR